MSDPVALAAIAMIGSVFSAIIGLCNTFLINRNKTNSDSQHIVTTATLNRVEAQTNGLTHALVKATGDESFARGIIQGKMVEKEILQHKDDKP